MQKISVRPITLYCSTHLLTQPLITAVPATQLFMPVSIHISVGNACNYHDLLRSLPGLSPARARPAPRHDVGAAEGPGAERVPGAVAEHGAGHPAAAAAGPGHQGRLAEPVLVHAHRLPVG